MRRSSTLLGVARTQGRLLAEKMWTVLPVFGAPVFFYLAYLVARLSTKGAPLALFISVAFAAAWVLLAWLRFSQAGRDLAETQKSDVVGTIAVSFFLAAVSTAGFAAMSTALYSLDVGAFEEERLGSRSATFDAVYSSYLWHLADFIPLLKVPETLSWELAHPLQNTAQGGLTLAYKVLVGVPIVWTATRLIESWLQDADLAAPVPTDDGDGASLPADQRQQ